MSISKGADLSYDVAFYRDRAGHCPFEGFLDGLQPKLRAKITRDLGLLEANGPALREPISKPLGDGLFELRTKLGSDIARSLYFFHAGRAVVVTGGFVKKTRKAPRAEIERALARRADWLERRAEHE